MPEPEQVGKVAARLVDALPSPTSRKESLTNPEGSSSTLTTPDDRLQAFRAAVQAKPDAYMGQVPTLYRRARLSDFGARVAATALLGKGGLFVCGTTGVGKTHLAAALFRANLHRACVHESERYPELSAVWTTVPGVLLRLRATFNGAGSESDVVKELADARLLVLDDLGAERQSEWTALALYSIISDRVNWRRPTIVTSNLTLKEIDAADPRLASRLGGMAQITLTGADRRLAAIAERTDAATADRSET